MTTFAAICSGCRVGISGAVCDSSPVAPGVGGGYYQGG